MLRVTDLWKTYPGPGGASVAALQGVELAVEAGEVVALYGRSGSGKTTLLNLLAGLDRPSRGRVEVEGTDLAALGEKGRTRYRRLRLGFVFQFFNLLPILTAVENVALPLVIDGVREAEATEKALQAMDAVGMAHRRDHRPGELSGGEQQRVAIARALVTDPVLILADEPTGNLDSSTGDQVMTLLRGLVDERGQTILMVTHDPRDAATADTLLTLRDGRVAHQQHLSRGRSLGEVLRELGGLA